LQVCRTITVAFNCQNALVFFKYNFLDFFENYGEAYDYYHKLKGNIYYFAKLKGKKGILVTFEIGADIVVSSISEISKGLGTDFTKEKIRDE
jgi:hypothetical protein